MRALVMKDARARIIVRLPDGRVGRLLGIGRASNRANVLVAGKHVRIDSTVLVREPPGMVPRTAPTGLMYASSTVSVITTNETSPAVAGNDERGSKDLDRRP